MAKKRPRKWMSRAFGKHPGKLHRRLHVPEGEKIPEKKLEKAEHSSDPSERREAALAETGRRFGHKGGRHAARRPRRSRVRSAQRAARTRSRRMSRRR